MKPVTAIFDIGKTNKKMLLFDEDLQIIHETEKNFPEIKDDDGYECDNIELIERWIRDSVEEQARSVLHDLKAINFTTYGATLVYLDQKGKRLTPVYNYLKTIDEEISEYLYGKYGGRDEFCRRTASPALGMLNSGIQPLWLRSVRPEVFKRIKDILHFPQYLSYIFTGKIHAEHTSIGCHTALWDFDNMRYHPWVEKEVIGLSQPVPVETVEKISVGAKEILAGIGIHDSSSSLAPYFSAGKGKFLLLSTGTWCINMNPFNDEKLTAGQLNKDCLCYLSITGQPVKSSRLFMGHMHETAVKRLSEHFNKPSGYFKNVKRDDKFIKSLGDKSHNEKIFFLNSGGRYELTNNSNLNMFESYEESYHHLMRELCDLEIAAVKLVLPADDTTDTVFVTGGFSKNDLFLFFLSGAFPEKRLFTSEISNASALGAALVISEDRTVPDLGLAEYKSV